MENKLMIDIDNAIKYISDRNNMSTATSTTPISGSLLYTDKFSYPTGIHIESEIPMEMPKETSTYVYEKNSKIKVGTYENGRLEHIIEIMPTINDIRIINDNVIIMYFSDGTTEKAVLNHEDVFSLEQGISICITKKILSIFTGNNGSPVYNKLIKHCEKIYNKKLREKQKAKEKEELLKINREKFALKKAKKAAKIRESKIEIQKEAYLRAMREYNKNV